MVGDPRGQLQQSYRSSALRFREIARDCVLNAENAGGEGAGRLRGRGLHASIVTGLQLKACICGRVGRGTHARSLILNLWGTMLAISTPDPSIARRMSFQHNHATPTTGRRGPAPGVGFAYLV